jgi:hypothetical protein
MNKTITLLENIEKEATTHPDFIGPMMIGETKYEAAAWLNRTRKDNSPLVSLQLSISRDESVSVALWQKKNRTSASDPHFRGKQLINDTHWNFSAWLETQRSGMHSLRIEFSELGAELTQAAIENRSKIENFIKELSIKPIVEPDPVVSAPAKRIGKPELDNEPDDIPF